MQSLGNIEQVFRELTAAAPKRILILPHLRTDPDAIGSAVGLSEFLTRYNHSAEIIVDEKPAKNLEFLYQGSTLRIFGKDSIPEEPDLLIYLDHHEKQRLGNRERILEAHPNIPLVIIDHHLLTEATAADFLAKPEFIGRELAYWIDSDRSSVSEMVAELFFVETPTCPEDNSLSGFAPDLTQQAAAALLAGIYGDTGGLRYSNTSARTFAICGKLKLDNVNVDEIADKLFAEKSLDQLRMMGYIYENSSLNKRKNMIWFVATNKLLRKYHATQEDLEGVSSELRNIANIDLAILIREIDRDTVRVNLRSNENFDCSILANHFGGGGHKRASGITFEKQGDLAEISEKLIETAEIMLNGE